MAMKPKGNQPTEETPAEMAERVHQVISVIADAVLKLAHERFGIAAPDDKDQSIDKGQRRR